MQIYLLWYDVLAAKLCKDCDWREYVCPSFKNTCIFKQQFSGQNLLFVRMSRRVCPSQQQAAAERTRRQDAGFGR